VELGTTSYTVSGPRAPAEILTDRLWQIDLWRRRGLGLLSEVFGSLFVEQDRAAWLFLYHGEMPSEWLAYGRTPSG
jgi:hypothetical protein